MQQVKKDKPNKGQSGNRSNRETAIPGKDTAKEKSRRMVKNGGIEKSDKKEYLGKAQRSDNRKAFDKNRTFKENKELDKMQLSGDKIKKTPDTVKEKTANTKDSLCPYARKCGGCQFISLSYEQQKKLKQKNVEDLLRKYGKVEPILGMKDPFHYRNKVHAVFDRDKKGNPISGVYETGTHRVVSVEHCFIEDQKAGEIILSIRDMLKSFKIKTYDEDSDYGLLRHVLIRRGFNSKEIMVVLVISSPIFPSKNNFVKALLKLHPEITTIVLNVNDKKTSMVLGDKEQVIYGKGYIEDTLCGKVFKISPKSFYQVNPVQTEVLYGKAIELAGLTGKETIVDAYCGIGTIGLIAGGKAQKVIGVELNRDAVRDAVTNAKRNKITNVEFYQNDAGIFMEQMASFGQKADVVFMDPPRTGSDEKFLHSLCTLEPKKIVYISCNPETAARDLEFLKGKYRVERIIPVDMFPWTSHVETVCLLTKNI